MVLGAFGSEMTVEQARTEASEHLRFVRKGDDPLEAKRRSERGETFKDLSDAYLEQHSKPNKKTWKGDQRRLKQHIPARWKARSAENITRTDVTGLYNKIRARAPYEANRLLALLRHMFGWAKLQSPSYISKDAIRDGWENPAILPKDAKFKEKKRKRYVRPDELPAIAQAIDGESNIYVRAAIWLYLLTGVRKAELLSVRRKRDIDWQRGILTLPETKAGEEQTVPLSAPALAIMQATPAQEENPYLLPGRKKGHHLVNINKPWGRIRTAAGIEDVRLHDLRRTVGSWMTQAGVDLNRIKDALRHADIATTLTYARLGEDTARDAMEDHGRRIIEAAGEHGPLRVMDGGKRET